MNQMKVQDVMTHMVVTLRPTDTIQTAGARFLSNRISGAPVVERGRLVGILSESDLVAAYEPPAPLSPAPVRLDPLLYLLQGRTPRDENRTEVGYFMTRDVITVAPDDSIWVAAARIDRYGIRRLPVIDGNGYVVGVLARSDLVRSMVRGDQAVGASVKAAIGALGMENFIGLEVDVDEGRVTLRGTADRRSTHDITLRVTANVAGVLEVEDELDWEWDDTRTSPGRALGDPHETERAPWSSGPLLSEGR